MHLKDVFNKLYKILLVVMLLLWGIITYSTVFNIYNSSLNLSSTVILLGVMTLLSILLLIYRRLNNYTNVQHDKIAFAIFMIVFFVMGFWGINYQTLPTYDLSHVIDKVSSMIASNSMTFGSSTYFSIYPNQVPLALFVYAIESFGKLLTITNLGNFMILYNCFMTSFSMYIIYKIIKKIFNSRVAIIGLILLAIYPDFYLYSTYYYSDILSLPFSIIGYFLLLKGGDQAGIKNNIYFILSGIIFAIGFKLRVVIVILLIAYLINIFIKADFKIFFKRTLLIFMGFCGSLLVFSNVIYPLFKVDLDESLKLPATHWVMMGLNLETDGGYTDEDVMYSLKSEKQSNAIFKRIKYRLAGVEPRFYFNKLSKVWSEGDHDILRKYGMMNRYGTMFNLLEGKNNIFIKYLQQILKAVIYLLFLITIMKELFVKKRSNSATTIIAIFGAIIFYLLWEALNRYSFSFLPWIIIGGVPAIEVLNKLVNTKQIKFDKVTFDFAKIKRYLYIIILVLTIILFAFGFYKYALKVTNIDHYRLVQDNSTKYFVPVIDDEIKEVFKVSKDFNKIQLQVSLLNVNKNVDYIYEIYDEYNNLLYKDIYTIKPGTMDKIENSLMIRNINFKFPVVKTNHEKEYYLKFYSKKATSKNYISLNTFVLSEEIRDDKYFSPEFLGSNYDINPRGKTYINDTYFKGSLRIRISLNEKTTIMKKELFILLAIFVIIIVVMSNYKVLMKEEKRWKRKDQF